MGETVDLLRGCAPGATIAAAMKRFLAVLSFAAGLALSQAAPPMSATATQSGAVSAVGTAPAPIPAIKKNGAVMQMMVDGKPFIMLAGELHNSSASSSEYMKPIWKKLAAMNLNTVIGTVSWELVEPQEGTFDFALCQSLGLPRRV
jgi:hypothetical protein